MPRVRVAFAVGQIALVGAMLPLAAGAQVQAQFFAPFAVTPLDDPGPPPSPDAPFPGTRVCTTTGIGNAFGLSLDFTTAATQSVLSTACGSSVAPMLVHSFGVRLRANLVAPVAKTYTLALDSDRPHRLGEQRRPTGQRHRVPGCRRQPVRVRLLRGAIPRSGGGASVRRSSLVDNDLGPI